MPCGRDGWISTRSQTQMCPNPPILRRKSAVTCCSWSDVRLRECRPQTQMSHQVAREEPWRLA
jgi:hypothetical protein